MGRRVQAEAIETMSVRRTVEMVSVLWVWFQWATREWSGQGTYERRKYECSKA